VKNQSQSFKGQLQNLTDNSALIIYDYTTFQETAKFKLKDLNFAIYYQKNGKKELLFVDYFSKSFRIARREWKNYSSKLFRTLPWTFCL